MAKQGPDPAMMVGDRVGGPHPMVSTLYKLAQEGKLPAQKVGRHWRFHRRAVDQWLLSPRGLPTHHTGARIR